MSNQNTSAIDFSKALRSSIEPDTISLTEEKEKLEHVRFEQDTKYRSLFSDWVIIYISLYTVFVVLLLIGVGHGWMSLDTTVVVTLLGTTTANILGLAYIILHGLFDKDKLGHR